MKVSVYIGMSLDGCIATTDGGLDWLMELPNPDGSDFGFSEFMAGVDAVVMGRSTFDHVVKSGQWPYEKPVFVLSRNLVSLPEESEGKASLLRGSPREIMTEMENRGYGSIYVDGGNVVQQFLNDDLVDELILTRIPVLLGSGIRLFANLEGKSHWKHEATEVLAGQMVKSRYSKQG